MNLSIIINLITVFFSLSSSSDKPLWVQIVSCGGFYLWCASLVFTGGLIWYCNRRDRELLLAEQKEKEEHEKTNQHQVETEKCIENVDHPSTPTDILNSTPIVDSFDFNSFMVELAFWGIIISSICLFVFFLYLLYGFLNKIEAWVDAFFEKRKNK